MKNLFYRLCFFTLVAAVLAACASSVVLKTPFNPADFESFSKSGTSTITGQAFLKTRGGDVKYGAGNEVKLIPYNTYIAEMLTAIESNRNIQNLDKRYQQYTRTTVADGVGNFRFENIPAGSYLLQCLIFWEVPSGYVSSTTGSRVVKHVAVEESKTANIMLTE